MMQNELANKKVETLELFKTILSEAHIESEINEVQGMKELNAIRLNLDSIGAILKAIDFKNDGYVTWLQSLSLAVKEKQYELDGVKIDSASKQLIQKYDLDF